MSGLNVSLETAYAEALAALGEAIVTQRLLMIELAKQQSPEGDTGETQ